MACQPLLHAFAHLFAASRHLSSFSCPAEHCGLCKPLILPPHSRRECVASRRSRSVRDARSFDRWSKAGVSVRVYPRLDCIRLADKTGDA